LQESVIGSVFEARYERGEPGRILPRITGRAHVTLDAKVVIDPADPFAWGLPA
jgi:proline racemase